MEAHGTIVAGRWKGTRGAEMFRCGTFVTVRPFNDTAETEDARMHLSPMRPITMPIEAWKPDGCLT